MPVFSTDALGFATLLVGWLVIQGGSSMNPLVTRIKMAVTKT